MVKSKASPPRALPLLMAMSQSAASPKSSSSTCHGGSWSLNGIPIGNVCINLIYIYVCVCYIIYVILYMLYYKDLLYYICMYIYILYMLYYICYIICIYIYHI
jgi:hypothetical protein